MLGGIVDRRQGLIGFLRVNQVPIRPPSVGILPEHLLHHESEGQLFSLCLLEHCIAWDTTCLKSSSVGRPCLAVGFRDIRSIWPDSSLQSDPCPGRVRERAWCAKLDNAGVSEPGPEEGIPKCLAICPFGVLAEGAGNETDQKESQAHRQANDDKNRPDCFAWLFRLN